MSDRNKWRASCTWLCSFRPSSTGQTLLYRHWESMQARCYMCCVQYRPCSGEVILAQVALTCTNKQPLTWEAQQDHDSTRTDSALMAPPK
eukprot:1554619-Amphidinium_carterae.1